MCHFDEDLLNHATNDDLNPIIDPTDFSDRSHEDISLESFNDSFHDSVLSLNKEDIDLIEHITESNSFGENSHENTPSFEHPELPNESHENGHIDLHEISFGSLYGNCSVGCSGSCEGACNQVCSNSCFESCSGSYSK